jgi:DNA-binding Xre family transcriptional regulator
VDFQSDLETKAVILPSTYTVKGTGKGRAIPLQQLRVSEHEVPKFQNNGHLKVIRFSALNTGFFNAH